jgi:hypothetical protein
VFEEFYQWAHHQATQNDVFAGLVGGSVFMSGLYLLRGLPNQLWRLFLHQFTCLVVVHNDDEAFQWIDAWLSQQKYASKARRLRLKTYYGEVPRASDGRPYQVVGRGNSESYCWTLSPGYGHHVFWYNYRPFWLERSKSESDQVWMTKETFEIRILGRGQNLVRDLVSHAQSMSFGPDHVEVKSYDGGWHSSSKKAPRSVDSLILCGRQLEDVLEDAEWFFGAAEWYHERGIPWRRGYLLSGVPGTGKSTLAFVLASHFKVPLYVLNLGSLMSDSQVFRAMSDIPEGSILLVEDVDASKALAGEAKRTKKQQVSTERPPAAPSPEPKVEGDDEVGKLTLSAFLNALDGVASNEGRLLVMTTNYPDELDAALVRPGRVDRHEHVGPLGTKEARRLFLRFWPDEGLVAQGLELAQPLPAAVLQETFVRHRDDPQAAVEAVMQFVNPGFTNLTVSKGPSKQVVTEPSQRKVKA